MLLTIFLIFCQFQPGIAYESVAYKKTAHVFDDKYIHKFPLGPTNKSGSSNRSTQFKDNFPWSKDQKDYSSQDNNKLNFCNEKEHPPLSLKDS